MRDKIGSKLKNLRKQKGWSQELVADKLRLSQSAYARIESGNSHSWASHLDTICSIYEITPEELLKCDNVIINSQQKGGNSNNAFIINQLSEKLIEQYENRLKEKEELIAELKAKLKL
jgi:transcriptional regulator with XRE-family HTH domain